MSIFHGNRGRQMLLFETPKCDSSINLFISKQLLYKNESIASPFSHH